MIKVIREYDTLLNELENLPQPAPGYVRVYRGQTAHYPVMLPTMLRGNPDPRDHVWQLYASIVARDVAGDNDSSVDLLQLLTMWVYALKQHYGPGTQFLDVTYSPAIAAWFALHRSEVHDQIGVYVSPSPVDPQLEIEGRHPVVQYFAATESSGYLYAFDVPNHIEDLPSWRHGALIDLTKAPSFIGMSPRIRVQKACLLYADPQVNGGDLTSFLVKGTPLAIGWPLEGCEEARWSTNQIYPPASEDHWYERFVSVPLALRLEKADSSGVFDHPIRVGLYMPATLEDDPDIAGLNALMECMYAIKPPLLYPATVELAKDEPDSVWQRLKEATPILLEGPVLYALPPVQEDTWNIGLLVSDLADSIPVRDLLTGNVVGDAQLDNVFFEVNLLERAGWERVRDGSHRQEPLRGIWLVRDKDQFLLTLFTQELPGTDEIFRQGPIPMRYDPGTKTFLTQPVPPMWLPLIGMSQKFSGRSGIDVAGTFMKVLSLVRTLSPGWKIAHHITSSFQTPEGRKSLVQVQWALADLVGLQSLGGLVAPYHVLRIFGSNEVFLGGVPDSAPVVAGMLTVTGQAFNEIDPEALRQSTVNDLTALKEPTRP